MHEAGRMQARFTEGPWQYANRCSEESGVFRASSVAPVAVLSHISNIHLPVVPPPGGSLEMTPGNLRQRKSRPYRW